MKNIKRLIPVLLLLFLSSPVYADDLQGVVDADFQLGLEAYEKGDYQTAFKEFKALAGQGDADAQFCLGVMYVNGQGVPKDYIQAHMWLNLAGVNRDKKTEELRTFIEDRMTSYDISEAQRLTREWVEKHRRK